MAPSDEIPPANVAEGIVLLPPAGGPTISHAAAPDPSGLPPDFAAPASGRTGKALVLLVAALALLLASFPARNGDLWMHLAAGRLLAHGEPVSAEAVGLPAGQRVTAHWLYDLLSYGVYALAGGAGLVLVKAALVVGIALLLLRLSWTGRGWWVPAFCTALALLAMSTRLLLQPATLSYLFLALALWFVRERGQGPAKQPVRLLPPWPLFVLFVAWANADGWFVLGLATVGLVWLGQALDCERTKDGSARSVLRPLSFVLPLALLAAACLLNPGHVAAFALPAELGSLGAAGDTSPFQRAYFAHVGLTPAGLAYYPLLALTLLSFALTLPHWSWRRSLPCLGLALLSVVQVRAVPFFAVVAGPALAWNLQEFRVRRLESDGERWEGARAATSIGYALTFVMLLALLLSAWPGWLQGTPYEPRRWAVETPPSLERGAAATRRWHQEGKLGPDARGLHLSADSAYAFAWFCPEDKAVRDDELASAIREGTDNPSDVAARLRSAHVTHVVVHDTNRAKLLAALENLLADPVHWPVLYMEGDLIVFGWRDRAGAADPFADWQLDLNALAFRPDDAGKAPASSPAGEPEARAWWEAFWKPAPPRPIDQDGATLHLCHAEALRRSAPFRHQAAWEAAQSAAYLGAAGGWAGPGGVFDARLRLTLIRPLPPYQGTGFSGLPGADQLAHVLQHQFAFLHDDTPPAALYLAVRAARRAVAANPNDAQAYLVLGESYLRLLRSTRERAWADRLPELKELRHVQASAALNQAVALKPDLAQAHFSLGHLYGDMGYLDLMLNHMRAYRKLMDKADPPRGVTAEQFRQQLAAYAEEVSQLTTEVEKRQNKFEVATAGGKVLDRAFQALSDGLAGKARDLLLQSDVAAFGARGTAMELDLLLKTGQPKRVMEWTGPEHESALGTSYHWLRLHALAATGDYAAAEEEMNALLRFRAGNAPDEGPVRVRELMALVVARRLLEESGGTRCLPELFLRTVTRSEMRTRVASLEKILTREANLTVLRGLLALEQGEVERAEGDFRVALTLWKDAATAASGAGLDFDARPVAQGYLEWLGRE
jgi:hypothetical protein